MFNSTKGEMLALTNVFNIIRHRDFSKKISHSKNKI